MQFRDAPPTNSGVVADQDGWQRVDLLEVGDVVAADLRLLEVHALECDEAILTGESMTAAKTDQAVPPGASPMQLPSCAYMGTIVRSGSGRGVLVRTGATTAFGRI